MKPTNVSIPESFSPERKYIIKTLLDDYIGLTYKLNFSTEQQYTISAGDNKLIIEDHFFSELRGDYLDVKNLPKSVQFFNHPEIEEPIPVIYGMPSLYRKENYIYCGIDIFASSFFMLTRWEEYVNPAKDNHNRFPAKEAVAVKHRFLHLPVVDIYAELLFKLIKEINPDVERKKKWFRIIPTHDIDHIQRWSSISAIRKNLAHNFITQKQFSAGFQNIKDAALTLLSLHNDPYDTIEYLMAKAEEAGIKAHFYFMSGGTSIYDNNYAINDPRVINKIEVIKKRGHIVGFHPSYNSFDDEHHWKQEKEKLENVAKTSITSGRQHYLRFKVPQTWRLWSEYQMTDSTLGYAEIPGFRCGTCTEFNVFDVLKRKELPVKENPLILMETSLINYMKLPPNEAFSKAKELFDITVKYNGNFTFLWHNSALFTPETKDYRFIFEAILKNFRN